MVYFPCPISRGERQITDTVALRGGQVPLPTRRPPMPFMLVLCSAIPIDTNEMLFAEKRHTKHGYNLTKRTCDSRTLRIAVAMLSWRLGNRARSPNVVDDQAVHVNHSLLGFISTLLDP